CARRAYYYGSSSYFDYW
nr:immunoglobulin heavy chain junction region [Mus musculus]MBK4196955.1 immunoglobulin heavy chain junction region [Mus musculus]MBK4196956.1 immunoglobulin heavy chain junction region [Mus musculus]MBK4196957.1 immunoglobulin heavy chain junction region [Mus musculus]MBK4196958.1 immunoglobulin heavy chain junction region [Mus musculus]